MKISTKGRYALRMLIDLAENRDQGFVSLKDIAERQSISRKYLEQIVQLLNKTDMLKTSRGYNGGYMLAKDPSEYRVIDILELTEGNLACVTCLEDEVNECKRAGFCKSLKVWQGLDNVIRSYLSSITLQDLI
ncbi:MAG TPA: Rrf2 family transcriptional regulator [Clostridiaceae bacterium]|nr:Rrf2 family transcriptional regulator [Clostridiaceae bacterium]